MTNQRSGSGNRRPSPARRPQKWKKNYTNSVPAARGENDDDDDDDRSIEQFGPTNTSVNDERGKRRQGARLLGESLAKTVECGVRLRKNVL